MSHLFKAIDIIVIVVVIILLLTLGAHYFNVYPVQHHTTHTHYHINTSKINHSKLAQYGSAKFIQHKNTVVYTAKPYVAREIKHAKIHDTLPGKFSTLADHDTHYLRVHQHDHHLHEQFVPDN